jgi:hypothetical protein
MQGISWEAEDSTELEVENTLRLFESLGECLDPKQCASKKELEKIS